MSNYVNDFSWSYSRHTTFQTCLKKYYFSYYAAWGGWQENAAARTREIYRLKRLFTRQQWAGHHAHQAIGALLKNIPRRTDDSFAASVEARQIERMRREFRDSRSGAYRANPARIPGLFEHEYNLELPAEEWKATVDRMATAVRNFLASELWQEIQTLPEEAILAVEQRTHFILDGLKVWAVPDLVIRRNGRIAIYDWKTGASDPAEHRTQVGVYVLLGLESWTAAPEEISAVVYNPVQDEQEENVFTADEVETLREFIRDSADEMLFPMEDPATNNPGDGSNFDCTTDDEACKACPFLKVCPRWAN